MSSASAVGQVTELGQTSKLGLFQRIALRLPSKRGDWDSKVKFFETRLRLHLVIAVVATITALVIYWTFTQDINAADVRPLQAGVDLTIVLAPVLAAAAGVERFLETMFGVVEGNWKTLVAYLGRGLRWLHNAEAEVESARQWLSEASTIYTRQLSELSFAKLEAEAQTSDTTSPDQLKPPDIVTLDNKIATLADERLKAAKAVIAQAEQRLKAAEVQLSTVTDSSGYTNAKRAAAIFLGLLLGLVVASASSLQMFALMGIKVGNPRIDVIITGLVIGSGSAPVHSLLNILQSAKDTLDSAQVYLESGKKNSQPPAQV